MFWPVLRKCCGNELKIRGPLAVAVTSLKEKKMVALNAGVCVV
jgi:hypothetical protein